MRVILTPFLILGFVLNRVYDTFFGWWFGPLVQKRENQALWDDVQANLYFLYTKGQPLKEKWPRPLPFDYASVYLTYENLRFCFTRGEAIQRYLSRSAMPQKTATSLKWLLPRSIARTSRTFRPVGTLLKRPS